MKKKILFVFILIFLITGCSKKTPEFNDNDIKVNVISYHSEVGFNTYNVEITNDGSNTIGYLNFYVKYPLKNSDGSSKENPYKVEGKISKSRPILIKAGEKANYIVNIPTRDIFKNSEIFDYEHPIYELNGLVIVGEKETPFGMIKPLDY